MKTAKRVIRKASWVLRASANIIDYSLFFLIEMLFLAFLPFYFEDLFYLMLIVLTPFIWAPFEALLVSTWGSTLGKALCGIIVRTDLGEKVSYKSALLKACFLKKRSETYSLSNTLFFKLTQWILVGGTVLTCWGAVILGLPLINHSLNNYKQWEGIDGWVNYDDEKGFTVLLPSYPETSSQTFDNPHTKDALVYNEFKSCEGNDKVCYSVGYLDLPRSWRFAGANTILKGALGIVEKHEKGKLINNNLTRHQKQPAMDFELSKEGKLLKGRLVLMGRTLYRVMLSHNESVESEEGKVDSFIESFQFPQLSSFS